MTADEIQIRRSVLVGSQRFAPGDEAALLAALPVGDVTIRSLMGHGLVVRIAAAPAPAGDTPVDPTSSASSATSAPAGDALSAAEATLSTLLKPDAEPGAGEPDGTETPTTEPTTAPGTGKQSSGNRAGR